MSPRDRAQAKRALEHLRSMLASQKGAAQSPTRRGIVERIRSLEADLNRSPGFDPESESESGLGSSRTRSRHGQPHSPTGLLAASHGRASAVTKNDGTKNRRRVSFACSPTGPGPEDEDEEAHHHAAVGHGTATEDEDTSPEGPGIGAG